VEARGREPSEGQAPAEAREHEGGPLDWRRWLSGASPREVLARIVPGDPLGLRARVARALEERALLVDADRARLAALARVARAAPRYRGHPELDAWLAEHVGRALDVLACGDESALGPDGEARVADAFDELAPRLGLDPTDLRRAAAAFHRLPGEDRRAFFDLVLERRTLDELARGRAESASALARRARRALLVVLEHALPVQAARSASGGEGQDGLRPRSTGGSR
jgi:hypothetical protein